MKFPNAFITLTGHSLGGAIAQLEGESSGLSTIAFNAPGGGQLVSSLSNAMALGSSQWLLSTGVNINYSVYNDQPSLTGTPIGTSVTLPKPAGTTFVGTPTGSNAVAWAVNNSSAIKLVHSATTVIAQIDSQPISPAGQLNDAAAIQSTAIPTAALQFALPVLEAPKSYLIDPTGGSRFTLTGNVSSPQLASLDLPSLSGVSSWSLSQEINGVWSGSQSLAPGSPYALASNVTSVMFSPLDGNGNPVTLNDGFVFGATFASSGTYSGTLTEVAQSFWTSAVNGNWSDATKWIGGVANADGVSAVINAFTGANVTITLDAPQSVGTIALGSGSPGVGYILNGSGSNTLTLSNMGNSQSAQITVQDGSHIINAPLLLLSDLVVTSTTATPWTLTFGSVSSISDGGYNLSLSLNASNGTLVLSGSDSYAGGTIVEAGTLVVTNPDALPEGSSLIIGADATTRFAPLQALSGAALVPEPSTIVLLGAGVISTLVSTGLRRRRVMPS